jgi:phosphoglycolate phosphatase-like HAD superfamily hydrolase
MSCDYIKQYGIKPSARPLYALLRMIKHHYHLGPIDLNRVAFVGDNCSDIMSAKNGKIRSVAVLCGHGYYDEIAALQPTLILPTIYEIPQNLDKLFPTLNRN